MIRLIDREFVRECSYAFPPDSPLPKVSSSLPKRLLGDKSRFEVDAEDLITLRFYLRSRIACIQTRDEIVSWHFDSASALQVKFHRTTQQSHSVIEAAQSAGPSISWDAATPSRARALGMQQFYLAGEQQENERQEGANSPAVLEGESVHFARNGESSNGESSNSENGRHTPHNGDHSDIARLDPSLAVVNGDGQHPDHGFVCLELLEAGSDKPHTVLSSDSYNLVLVGRYRLLAETLAGWANTRTTMVPS